MQCHIKMKQLKVHAARWMNPRYTMLNEKGKLLKNIVYTSSL